MDRVAWEGLQILERGACREKDAVLKKCGKIFSGAALQQCCVPEMVRNGIFSTFPNLFKFSMLLAFFHMFVDSRECEHILKKGDFSISFKISFRFFF